MKIITGDEFGLIKLISTQSKQILNQYGTIDESKSILNIFTNNNIDINNDNNSEISQNEEKEEEDLNLFVSSINENYILNWNKKNIISSYNNDTPNTSFISSTIQFNSINNNSSIFINGTTDDKIKIVTFDKDNKYINESTYLPVDNSNKSLKIKLRGVANSIYNNNESIYCLYQNTPLVLYNIEQQKIEFKGKNLPNDELNLRIPMHDTDIIEIKNNPRINYVSTAYGEIRLYDKKASPRPSMNKTITKSKINKIDITEDNNYLFVGDNQGYCAMLDIRKSFSPFKTFRGISACIKSLVNIEKKNSLIVTGFDRYLRWYDYKSGNNDKIFLKNKINNAVLVGLEPEKKVNFEEEEESEIDDSELIDEQNEENEEEEDDEEDEEENIKEIKEDKGKEKSKNISEKKTNKKNNNKNDDNKEKKEDKEDVEEEEEEDEDKVEEEDKEEEEDDEDENDLEDEEDDELGEEELKEEEEEEESENNQKRKRKKDNDKISQNILAKNK